MRVAGVPMSMACMEPIGKQIIPYFDLKPLTLAVVTVSPLMHTVVLQVRL